MSDTAVDVPEVATVTTPETAIAATVGAALLIFL